MRYSASRLLLLAALLAGVAAEHAHEPEKHHEAEKHHDKEKEKEPHHHEHEHEPKKAATLVPVPNATLSGPSALVEEHNALGTNSTKPKDPDAIEDFFEVARTQPDHTRNAAALRAASAHSERSGTRVES